MFKKTFLFSAAILLPTAAFAGEVPLYKPAPDWVLPSPSATTVKPPAGGNPLVIFDQQQRLDDNGSWDYVERVMRATSSEVLRSIGTVTVQWHPTKGDLIVHKAEIVRGAQSIDLLAEGAKFTILRRGELLEMQQITGLYTATMSVEGLRVGDLLRISYSVTFQDTALGKNVETAEILLAQPRAPAFARYRLLWPVAQKVNWRTSAKTADAKVVTKGGMNELTIMLPLPKSPDMPYDAPSRFNSPPMVEASTFTNWAEVSRASAPLYRTEGLIPADSPMRGEIKRIMATATTPRERAALTLQLVQDKIRYLAIGTGDGNYVPQTPVRTWEARFGDCKAKTLLLLALLHEMKIKAEPVLAHIMLDDLVANRMPSFGAFNHVLVRAEIDGMSLWLDGTGSGSRLQDIEDIPAFRNVLPVRVGGAELMKLAARATARPDEAIDLEVDMSAGLHFPAPYRFKGTYRGFQAHMIRMMSTGLEAKELKEFVIGVVSSSTNNGSVVSYSINFDEDAGLAVVAASGLTTVRSDKTSGRYRIDVAQFDTGSTDAVDFKPDRARAEWKDIPAAVRPVHRQIKLRFRLPDYTSTFTLEGNPNISESYAGKEVVRAARIEGQWLTWEDRIVTRGEEIAADEIAQAKLKAAAVMQRQVRIVAPTDYPARWQLSQAAMRSKKLNPILALLDKAISSDPEDVQGYRNRANMLTGIYERRKALADLGEVIEREPDVPAYLARASALMDVNELEAATKDLEAAFALDPSSLQVLATLALTKARGGKFDEAFEILDRGAGFNGYEKLALQVYRAWIMDWAGRTDESLQLLNTLTDEFPTHAFILNQRCLLRATRGRDLQLALDDCTRSLQFGGGSAALARRALVHYRLKQYDAALADLEAANTMAPGDADVLAFRSLVRKAKGEKNAADDLAAAKMIAPRRIADLALQGLAL